MPISTMDEKFAYELGSIYDAEQQFLAAQREMVEQASDNALKNMLQAHIAQTEQQIANLEEAFRILEQPAQRVPCDAAAGLANDGRKALGEVAGNPRLIDCLILASQMTTEHLEMAAYRGLVLGAELTGHQDVAQLLRQNLQQEERTAEMLEQSAPGMLKETIQALSVGG